MLHRVSGALDKSDEKTHIPFWFRVPAGVQLLEVRFSYAPVVAQSGLPHNELSLSLFDPLGCRGTRHNNRQLNVLLGADAATPGFTAGPPLAGVWCAVIDVHRVVPGCMVMYSLEVRVADPAAPLPGWADAPADAPRIMPALAPPGTPGGNRGPGWYRGDLHAHSLHSDAGWDIPDLLAAARTEGLDFVSLTDHNTVSGLPELHAAADDGLLTIGGTELSTFRGHALALGLDTWQEWRLEPHSGPRSTAPELFAAVQRRAGLLVMAHPMSVGSPWRSGSLWEYAELMPGPIRCIEVWNGSWHGGSNNEQALQLFYFWLNQGHRLVATSGSDSHGPWAGRTGIAFNHVWAEELSVAAVLAGLAEGRSYLSAGPRMEVFAAGSTSDGAPATVGGELPRGEPVRLTVGWSGGTEGDALRLVSEGSVRFTHTCGDTEGLWTIDLNAMPAWFTVELRGPDGDLRALVNPVYGADG